MSTYEVHAVFIVEAEDIEEAAAEMWRKYPEADRMDEFIEIDPNSEGLNDD